MIVFQAFVYTLKCSLVDDESSDLIDNGPPASPGEGWGGSPLAAPKPAYISAVLDCLSTIMSMFRITWRDSVESMYLLSLPLNVLMNENLVRTVGVRVLCNSGRGAFDNAKNHKRQRRKRRASP